ncbi:MAG: hypothetical protein WBA76_07675 [Phormidesmis sp.]
MDIQQHIGQQRIRHIIDSYQLMGAGNEANRFDAYMSELLSQYPPALIELALVETLAENWLRIPMEKGVIFLAAAHEQIKQWQSKAVAIRLTPNQFSQITGLDPHLAFAAWINSIDSSTALPTQAAAE